MLNLPLVTPSNSYEAPLSVLQPVTHVRSGPSQLLEALQYTENKTTKFSLSRLLSKKCIIDHVYGTCAAAAQRFEYLTLGARAQRGLRYLVFPLYPGYIVVRPSVRTLIRM